MPEILVVDDSRVMREMVIACLRAEPRLAFTQATSGLEAIERLSLKAYDLMVLDLNMPDIGGFEVLEFLRAQDQLRSLPVIVVTTRGDDPSRTRALASGASSFMTKPFTPEQILGEVRALLGAGAPPLVSDGFAVEDFLAAYLAEAEEHVRTANENLLEIEGALKTGKASARAVRELFRALHTVKGLSAMVGVEPVVEVTHRMEHALRGLDRSGAKLTLRAVDVLLQGVRAVDRNLRSLAHGETLLPPAPALLDALERLDAVAEPQPVASTVSLHLAPELAGKLGEIELQQLTEGVLGGARAVRVDFAPSPARAERGLSINTVRQRLGALGELVKVVPLAVAATEAAPGGLSFAVVMLTAAEDAAIAAAIEIDPASIELVAAAVTAPASSMPPIFVQVESEIDARELDLDPARSGLLRVEVSRVEAAVEQLSALVVTRLRLERCLVELRASGADTRDFAQVLTDYGKQVRDLRATVLRLRMVRMADVLERLPLLVRGLRRDTGKQVRLETANAGTEIDKEVADRLFPALVHLVRNAVDHGIELPEDRRRSGKPDEGVLLIRCSTFSRTQLEVTVEDDGRGIDAAEAAHRAGVPTPETAAGLLEIVCRAGISTKAEVTKTSGRGVGLDVVKRIVVIELGGELLLRTNPGVGTTFVLRVPLTISIVDAFAFECSGQSFVVPVASVEEIIELPQTPPIRAPGRASSPGVTMVERRGEAVSVVDLETALGGVAPVGPRERKALIVRRAGELVAFAVDRMLGQKEAVVRPLKDPLVQIRGIAGATDLGDGRPTLVLDLLSLADARHQELAR